MSRIRNVNVLYDGTTHPFLEFSLAELELHDGSVVIGIRHDRNEWNENNEENGYPVVRGGRPSWFILPQMTALLPVLNHVFRKQKSPISNPTHKGVRKA
jgi:hypothetical protein